VRVLEPGSSSQGGVTPVRLMASSMTGEFLRTDAFLEYPDPVTGITKQFCSITREDQICLLSPYPASNSIQTRRASARRIGSTYAYDFLGLMEVSLIQKWDKHLKEVASTFPSRGDEKIPESVRFLVVGVLVCLGFLVLPCVERHAFVDVVDGAHVCRCRCRDGECVENGDDGARFLHMKDTHSTPA
jgi:hypothetical protein